MLRGQGMWRVSSGVLLGRACFVKEPSARFGLAYYGADGRQKAGSGGWGASRL